MLAGVYTDVLQGGWMMLAAMGVFVYALRSGGGIRDIAAAITDSPDFGARFLEPFGGAPVLTAMGFFFVFSIGVLGQPQMLHKFYMLDDPRKLRWMPLVIGLAQSACLLIWLGIGLAVPALVARGRIVAPDSPDAATPAFLLEVTPPLLAATVLAGILAAIMSTADSFVNIGSAALVRDLPGVFGVRVRRELLWGRVATVGIMLAAAGLALTYGDLIALLGTFAFGTFAAALAPALAVGWNWKRVTPAAATASIATGLVLNLGLEFLAKQSWFPGLPRPGLAQGALPAAVSLAASFAVLLLVTLLDPRARPAPEADICAVMDA